MQPLHPVLLSSIAYSHCSLQNPLQHASDYLLISALHVVLQTFASYTRILLSSVAFSRSDPPTHSRAQFHSFSTGSYDLLHHEIHLHQIPIPKAPTLGLLHFHLHFSFDSSSISQPMIQQHPSSIHLHPLLQAHHHPFHHRHHHHVYLVFLSIHQHPLYLLHLLSAFDSFFHLFLFFLYFSSPTSLYYSALQLSSNLHNHLHHPLVLHPYHHRYLPRLLLLLQVPHHRSNLPKYDQIDDVIDSPQVQLYASK
mmetsp:Transcript_1323/g.2418  ORF Transcript_1323/g.2418 Transcript_1323/m.2418 type:complete len:252 (-) Transcript_1323:98-853(-)